MTTAHHEWYDLTTSLKEARRQGSNVNETKALPRCFQQVELPLVLVILWLRKALIAPRRCVEATAHLLPLIDSPRAGYCWAGWMLVSSARTSGTDSYETNSARRSMSWSGSKASATAVKVRICSRLCTERSAEAVSSDAPYTRPSVCQPDCKAPTGRLGWHDD
jgi:hypothetical protein